MLFNGFYTKDLPKNTKYGWAYFTIGMDQYFLVYPTDYV